MSHLKIKRNDNEKIEKEVIFLSSETLSLVELSNTKAKYIVVAVIGETRELETWINCQQSLSEFKDNSFHKKDKTHVLGAVDFRHEQQLLDELLVDKKKNRKQIDDVITRIDKEVTSIVHSIANSGKKVLIISSAQFSSYGAIKGCSLSLNKPINAINFDLESDFQRLKGRGLKNSFSYALNEGFLDNYYIFGLGERYTSKNILSELNSLHDHVNYSTFESIAIRKETSFEEELDYASGVLNSRKVGIEIDLKHINSSVGFSLNEVRNFLHKITSQNKSLYLNITNAFNTPQIKGSGDVLAHLIADFSK